MEKKTSNPMYEHDPNFSLFKRNLYWNHAISGFAHLADFNMENYKNEMKYNVAEGQRVFLQNNGLERTFDGKDVPHAATADANFFLDQMQRANANREHFNGPGYSLLQPIKMVEIPDHDGRENSSFYNTEKPAEPKRKHKSKKHKTSSGEMTIKIEQDDNPDEGNYTMEKPFVCDQCDFTCTLFFSMKEHELSHSGKSSYFCDQCSFKCRQLNRYIAHKNRHNGIAPFSCDQCDYKCLQQVNMQVHKRRHSGDKPFACDVCSYTCKQISNLQVHKRKHTGQKPFACDECDYRCKQKSNLLVHKRKHTGEKPFACEKCTYRCRQLSNLQSHMQSHGFDQVLIKAYRAYEPKQD